MLKNLSKCFILKTRGRSSDWSERRPVTPEVAGSSPVGPAINLFFILINLCKFIILNSIEQKFI